MMTTSTECYVTIHDQDLVIDLENEGRFAQLSHTYLFVGRRPVDKLTEGKVIVCRDYEPNIEHLPQFYDFTGWWTLVNHHLISADRIICLQYDMHILQPNLEVQVDHLLRSGNGMVAFNAGYYGPNWMLRLPDFETLYRAGLATRGVNLDDIAPFNEWPCTQGTAWRREIFEDYLAWIAPMFDVFKDDIFAGHLMERTVKAYLAANGIPNGYLLGAIAHQAADMHGTGALMAGNRKLYEQRNAEFMGR